MNGKMEKLIEEMDEHLEYAYQNGLLKRPEEEKEDVRKENQESSY